MLRSPIGDQNWTRLLGQWVAFAASYPTLFAELRAHFSPPTKAVHGSFPNRTLPGAATDLAEILAMELSPSEQAQWSEDFYNYVGALRAVSFVESNSAVPEVRAGVFDLYQKALAKPLQIWPSTRIVRKSRGTKEIS